MIGVMIEMKQARQILANIITKAEEGEDRQFYVGVATTSDVDRVGERVNLKGLINLDEYLKNPILLFNHDIHSPIGRITKVNILDDRIEVEFTFANTPKAQEIKQLVDEGVLNALSIGFLSLQRLRDEAGNVVHNQWRWVETSVVTLPANPNAVIYRYLDEDKEVDETMEIEIMEIKGVVPDNDAEFPVYEDLEREWDADESEIRWRKYVCVETNEDLQDPKKRQKYAKRFFWVDDENADKFSAYKLPHVDVINGKPYAIWRGIVAAMAALLGARGGVDIPNEDREKVYRAIAKYYKKVDKEPPEFHKAVEFFKALRNLLIVIGGVNEDD
jgi:HK97 family phage prohead protease